MKKIYLLLLFQLFSFQVWSAERIVFNNDLSQVADITGDFDGLPTCKGSPKKQGAVFNVKIPKSWNDCKGTFIWRSGESVSGIWKDRVIYNGEGAFKYANKEIYKGKWKDGKFDGKGILIKSDNERVEGIWDDGKYIGTVAEVRAAEEARVAEQNRIAEQKRIADEKRVAEQRRVTDIEENNSSTSIPPEYISYYEKIIESFETLTSHWHDVLDGSSAPLPFLPDYNAVTWVNYIIWYVNLVIVMLFILKWIRYLLFKTNKPRALSIRAALLFLITSYNLRVFHDWFNSSDPDPFFNYYWFWTPGLIFLLLLGMLSEAGPKTDKRFRTGYKGNVTPRPMTDDEKYWDDFFTILMGLYVFSFVSWFISQWF